MRANPRHRSPSSPACGRGDSRASAAGEGVTACRNSQDTLTRAACGVSRLSRKRERGAFCAARCAFPNISPAKSQSQTPNLWPFNPRKARAGRQISGLSRRQVRLHNAGVASGRLPWSTIRKSRISHADDSRFRACRTAVPAHPGREAFTGIRASWGRFAITKWGGSGPPAAGALGPRPLLSRRTSE